VQDQLGAVHRESWDEDRSSSRHGTTDGCSQDFVAGDAIGWVSAVAVGRLDDHRAGCWRCLPGKEQRVTGSAEITGEQDRAATDRDQGAGRAQDVTCSAEGEMSTRVKVAVLVVVKRFE
jgi:hypothetical protein